MSASLPPVAVVIPLHNGDRWIRNTLTSVQAQSHPPAEIVVVDDHSTDEGPARAAAVPGVTVRALARPSVGGAGPGRQLGLEHTTAPLVAFLDQDDLWHPDHLRLLAELLATHPDAPAAVAGISVFDDGTPPRYDAPRLAPTPLDPWASFPLNDILSPSGVLVRRTALDAIGGWPADGAVTDFRAWFRLSMDRPFVANRCVTCAKRRHAASKSVDVTTNGRSAYLPYRTYHLRPLLADRIRRRPASAARLRRRMAALHALGRFAEAYETGRAAPLPSAAQALEALATTEPHVFDRLTAFLFRFLFGPAFRGSIAHQRAFLELFLSRWPNSAPETRRRLEALFVASLSLRSVLSFLRGAPLDPARWRLTRASVERAVRQRRARWRTWAGRLVPAVNA